MQEEKLTRSEQHEEEVKMFLASNARCLKLRLYGREIRPLEKKHPEIVITRGQVYRGSLYDCLAYKRKE